MSPDHLLMLADIAQVASERPELDETTVQALYQHLVLTQGGQPTIDQAREYVDRLTSSLGEHALRQRLGLVARRKRDSRASAKSGRGRPKGTRSAPPTDISVPGEIWVDELPESVEVAEQEQRKEALDQIRAAARLIVRPGGDAVGLSEPQPPGEGSGGQPRTQRQSRSRGRPKGTRSVTRDEIFEKFRSLRTNYGRNPTQAELAANLQPRIEVRALQAHLTEYDLSWPIE